MAPVPAPTLADRLPGLTSAWVELCKSPSNCRWHILKGSQKPVRQTTKGRAANCTWDKTRHCWITDHRKKKIVVTIDQVPELLLKERHTFQKGNNPFETYICKKYTGFNRKDIRCLRASLYPSPEDLNKPNEPNHPLTNPLLGPFTSWQSNWRFAESWSTFRGAFPEIPASTQAREIVDYIQGKTGIVFVIGAGVSVASGIPAFRTEDGLFSRAGKDMFCYACTPDEQQQRSKKLGELAQSTMNAAPTPFHHMMALLSEQDKLHRLYSQNIDELETRFKFLEADPYEKAGYRKMENQFVRTIQLHGGMRTTRCSKSNHIQELVPQDLINGFQETLQCARCEMKQQEVSRTKRYPRNAQLGINEANIVLYGKNPDDSKPERDMAFVDKDARNAAVGLIIVCGTSATLPSTKQLIENFANLEGHKRDSLWINTEDPPRLSGFTFTHCFKGDCQEIAWELLRRYKEIWESRVL